jgi:prepilin-type processing-associated H-X9-DG protein
MGGRRARARRRAMTLTELLIAMGLVALLVSLFMPVLSKLRSAAEAAGCLSHLRQMGTAWTMYAAENRGRLPDYVWSTPATPEVAWRGYWPGLLDRYEVRGETLLCPAARQPTQSSDNHGYGNVAHAWTGQYAYNGSAIRLNDKTYRTGSYGYNAHLTAGGGFGRGGGATDLGAVKNAAEVPAFMDCAYVDVRPINYTELSPAPAPPNLRGDAVTDQAPNHWRILIGRHGRGINVYMADGSGRWVRLDDLYTLQWEGDWVPYRLKLPGK